MLHSLRFSKFPASSRKVIPTALSVCLIALFFSLNALAQDPSAQDQQKLWYKIEVLVLQHLVPNTDSDETLLQPEELQYPKQWRWVSTEEELQAFEQSMQVEEMLATIKNDAEIQRMITEFRQNPIMVGTVPEEITNPGIGVNAEDASPMLFEEASSLEEALQNLQNAEQEEEQRFQPPRAFVHIKDKEQELAKIWQYLRWSRGFRPLWYRSWYQKIIPESPELATNILVEGPVNPQGERLISGSIRFWQESYLHASLDLWMFDYLPNVGQKDFPPQAPELRSPTKVETEQQQERGLLFTDIDNRIEMTFADTQKQQSPYQAFQFTDAYTTEEQASALQSPLDEDSYLDSRDLLAKQDLYQPIELRFIPEDLQTDEILLKTQPISRGLLQPAMGNLKLGSSSQIPASSSPTDHSDPADAQQYFELEITRPESSQSYNNTTDSSNTSVNMPSHNSSELSLTETASDEASQAKPVNGETQTLENPTSNLSFENSQLRFLTAPLIEGYKRADFLDLLEQPWKQYRVLQLNEKRRVKKGEVHYFDHPYFGVILKITAYKAPEPEQP